MSDQEGSRSEGNKKKWSFCGSTDSCSGDDSWWEDRSLPQKILIGTGFGILGIGLLFLFGWIVMLLWNWLIPDIIGWKPLNYWQAWGMLVLCTILFKGFGSSGGSGKSDRKRKKQLRRYLQEEDKQEGEI